MAITIPDRLYSEEDRIRLWNEYWTNNNKDYLKKPRRDSPTIKTSLSTVRPMYYVAFDDDIPIGYSGLEDNGPFYASAGTYVVPEYQEQGIAGKLVDKKMNKFRSKPAITFITNLEPYWKRFFLRRGWKIVDMSNLPSAIPKNVAQKEIDAYTKDNVLIYDGSTVTKAWQEILKKKKKKSTVNSAGNYTKPTMRKKIFNRIKAGNKGGASGQWSARKAQMLAVAYEGAGGGYRD